MENSPFSPPPISETGPKLPETDKKDKKKSKAIGSLTFEHPAPAEKTVEKSPLSALLEKQEPAERSAAEANTDSKPELSPDDTNYAVQQIAAERRAEVSQELIADEPEEQAAHAAAEEFYAQIVDDGLSLEQAAALAMPEDISDSTVEELPDKTDDEADQTVPTNPSSTAAGGAGSNGQAPRPPATPNSPSNPTPPSLPPHNTMPQNAAVQSLQHNQPSTTSHTEYVAYYDRSHAFGDALVGGIVGYLIGRRRGRIKTERKLLPVQAKLEREVKSLTTRLAETEFAIRQTAKQQFLERQANTQLKVDGVSFRNQQTAPEAVILDRRERPLPAPELHTRPNLLPPPERIGKVLVAAEARRSQPVESSQSKLEQVDKRSTEQQVENLSRNELLTLSEKIIVEGSTLRQVYETHLVSERGLRRLVTEYLRGGDVVRAFRRELIEREIDFERDPKLRDTVRKNLSGGGATTSPSLHKLLQQAGVTSNEDSKAELARARAQQLQDAKKQSKRASQRKKADISLITIIAVLLAIIVVLAVNRM